MDSPRLYTGGSSLKLSPLLNTHSTSQSGSIWNETIAIAVGGKTCSFFSPYRPHSAGCCHGLTPILLLSDNPELGPGTILSPYGTSESFSSSTGPSTIYSSTYPSTSQDVVLTSTTASLSHTVASSSSSTTSIHGPGGQSTHSSNTGAIAGGTVAGVVVISIVAVVSFRYGRRRSLLGQPAPSSDDGQAGGYNPWPMSGQEIITPSLPSPTIPLLRPYVRSYSIYSSCTCVFVRILSFSDS